MWARGRRNAGACLPPGVPVRCGNYCACGQRVRAKGKSVILVEMAEQFLSESISVKMEIELFFNMGCDSIFLLICQEEKLTD